MKVPEVTDARSEVNDVALYRKKKKRMAIIRNITILIIVCIAGFFVWLYKDIIFEPLRGIASKINTTTTTEVGFPIDLPASSEYRFLSLGDSFALVTDTYLYSYSDKGSQYFALQHGYVNPMAVSNSKRVLIYDKGGHDFALYNKTSEIYKQSIEDEVIVSAFISDSEHAAVVTSGGRYSNVVYVYDGNGKWLYTHKFVDDSIMQAGFSDDNSSLYLTRVRSDNGDIVTEITKYKLGSENEILWTYVISDCLPLNMSVQNNSVLVFGDSKVISFNADDGTVNGEYDYAGELKDISCDDNISAVVIDDYSTDGSRLVLLDNNCAVSASANIPSRVVSLNCTNDIVSVLTGRKIYAYDSSLAMTAEKNFDDDYSAFVRMDSQIILLGYNNVIIVELS